MVKEDALKCNGGEVGFGKNDALLSSTPQISSAVSRTQPQTSWAARPCGAVLQSSSAEPRLTAETRSTQPSEFVRESDHGSVRDSPDLFRACPKGGILPKDGGRPAGACRLSEIRTDEDAHSHATDSSRMSISCLESPALASGHPTLQASRRDSRFTHAPIQRAGHAFFSDAHTAGGKGAAIAAFGSLSNNWKGNARGVAGGGINESPRWTEVGGKRCVESEDDSMTLNTYWVSQEQSTGSSKGLWAKGAPDPGSRPYSRSPLKRPRFAGPEKNLDLSTTVVDTGISSHAPSNHSSCGVRVVGTSGGGHERLDPNRSLAAVSSRGMRLGNNTQAPQRKLLGFRWVEALALQFFARVTKSSATLLIESSMLPFMVPSSMEDTKKFITFPSHSILERDILFVLCRYA